VELEQETQQRPTLTGRWQHIAAVPGKTLGRRLGGQPLGSRFQPAQGLIARKGMPVHGMIGIIFHHGKCPSGRSKKPANSI
jgi:hypothetical protein